MSNVNRSCRMELSSAVVHYIHLHSPEASLFKTDRLHAAWRMFPCVTQVSTPDVLLQPHFIESTPKAWHRTNLIVATWKVRTILGGFVMEDVLSLCLKPARKVTGCPAWLSDPNCALVLLWCRLSNPKVDLPFGSAQGSGELSPVRRLAKVNGFVQVCGGVSKK